MSFTQYKSEDKWIWDIWIVNGKTKITNEEKINALIHIKKKLV